MWGWIERLRQFVQMATGRLLSRDAVRELGDVGLSHSERAVADATDRLIADQITLGEWERAMRQELKNSYIQQYLLGIGGEGQLSLVDYGSIGGMLAEQYKYLNDFSREMADGKLSPEQVRMRAAMYPRSAREARERANARAWGVPKLPAYPGDGQSECLVNCRCFWSIKETRDGWEATWALTPAEHCATCVENSQKWNPLVVKGG